MTVFLCHPVLALTAQLNNIISVKLVFARYFIVVQQTSKTCNSRQSGKCRVVLQTWLAASYKHTWTTFYELQKRPIAFLCTCVV